MRFKIYYYNGTSREIDVPVTVDADKPKAYYAGKLWDYVKFPEQIERYGEVKSIQALESLLHTEVYVDDMLDMFTNTVGESTADVDIVDFTTGEILWRSKDYDVLDPDCDDKAIPFSILKRLIITTATRYETVQLYI